MRKSRPVFTLIELLVVIAIMGILLSLLMPALKGAKKTAGKILCMSNTKNLNIAWTLYADDNKGYMPRGYGAWYLRMDMGAALGFQGKAVEQHT